jgi:hypothetical protein
MGIKKEFKVKIYSSNEGLELNADEIQYQIYENISYLDTVKVAEVLKTNKSQN